MIDKQQAVREFMLAAGQYVPDKLTIPNIETMTLRHELIKEELHELWLAIDSVYVTSRKHHLESVADAIGDLLYVVYGAAVAWGIDIDPIFAEIQRSNMTKFIDGYKREDGKWMKGPSYEPPKIREILEKQDAA